MVLRLSPRGSSLHPSRNLGAMSQRSSIHLPTELSGPERYSTRQVGIFLNETCQNRFPL